MANSDCPGCRAESETDEPGEGAVLTCIHCGYVGIWDVDAGTWRLLRPEEHAQLMKREEFLESLNFGFAFRAWRDRDTSNLCAVLHSKLDKEGLPGSLVASLAAEIIDAGYHTHPTDDDVRALGLDKYGDTL